MVVERPARFRFTPPTRLGRNHFALYRGYLDGVELGRLADLYLFECNPRTARCHVRWMQEQLAALARKHGRPRLGRLTKLEVPPADLGQPALDDWIVGQGLENFSESEQLEAYVAAFPESAGRRATRNRRLRDRQRELVRWLEDLEAVAPDLRDEVAVWLPAALAKPLKAAGIDRLAQLVERIQTHGYAWWRPIRLLGPARAEKVVQWIQSNATTLGALPQHALISARNRSALEPVPSPPESAIAPLEFVALPEELDGTQGRNRAPPLQCQLAARDDLQAVREWLKVRFKSERSHAVARGHAERFLLWSIRVKGKALSSLLPADCADYVGFLQNPPLNWRGPGAARWSPAWRPFLLRLDQLGRPTGLSAASVKCAVDYCRSLMGFLVETGWLMTNPWAAVGPVPAGRRQEKYRYLPRALWSRFLGLTDERVAAEANARNRRARFIILLAYHSGMRISEIARATTADLNYDPRETCWVLSIRGKGQQEREVPLSDVLFAAINEELELRGMNVLSLRMSSATPLVAALDGDGGQLSPKRIHQILKEHFGWAAERLAGSDPEGARALSTASAHWLRHSLGNHLVEDGVGVDVVQGIFGHASIATTSSYYVRAGTRRMAEALRNLR